MPPTSPADLPAQQGLYDPQDEHEACGVGFVAHAKGKASHDLVAQGLALLANLAHRGAAGCDPASGDGAGLLAQIPHRLFAQALAAQGVALPMPGRYGVGMLFLPAEEGARAAAEALVERAVADEGLGVLAWRDVPVRPEHIGAVARASQPSIRQVFVGPQRGR